MRDVVRSRLRRLPARADPQTTEHWLWMEWHGALRQFDPARADSFPGYVALRLRMAIAAAAREDDPLPRRARAQLRILQDAESELMQRLGRPLTATEHSALADSILGRWRPLISARLATAELPSEDLVARDPDPAAVVVQSSLRRAVRDTLTQAANHRSGGLLAWLDQAECHDRPPSMRVANVPAAVRDVLAAWTADGPSTADDPAA
jgi:hypothetical protein